MSLQKITYLLLVILFASAIVQGQDVVEYPLDTIGSAESKVQKLVYETPQLEIVSQDKDLLIFSFIWDFDATLDIAVFSIIGNTFHNDKIVYKGIPFEDAIDVSKYPTGIYLLKISDENGKIVLRKFTKY